MFAVIFADRDGKDLAPLNSAYSPAMLPIAGKPILEHTIEILRQRQVTNVIIVTNVHSDKVKAYFADGHRWSINITYVLSRPDEKPDEVIRRLGDTLPYPYLALRGDIWNGSIDEHDGVYCYDVTDPSLSINTLDWKCFHETQADLNQNSLSKLSDYHALALKISKRNSERAAANNRPSALSLGIQAQCKLTNIENGSLSLGHFSRVASSVRCSDTVVIGNHCIIDEGVQLTNTLVMDGTYIGPGMDVKHAIVLGNTLIRVDMDIICPIDEPFMLGNSSLEAFSVATMLERLMAGCCLVALLPVCLWLALCALKEAKKPLRLTPFTTGKKTLYLPEFTTAKRMHRVLPSLLAIMSGKLHLFGRPSDTGKTLEEDSFATWKDQYHNLPQAWISPASLLLGKDADPVVLELTEIELYQKGQVHYVLSCTYLMLKLGALKWFAFLVNKGNFKSPSKLTKEV